MNPDTLYKECNNHLREVDKKRDQLIAFYIAVIAAYLAALTKLEDTCEKKVEIIIIMVSISLFALGILLIFNLIEYRKWHLQYAHTARLLQALPNKAKINRKDYELVEEEVKAEVKAYEKLETNDKKRWRGYWKGVEFLTFNGFLIISFVPLYLFLYYLLHNMSCFCIVITFICIVFFYLVLFNFIAKCTLIRHFQKSLWADWLLYGITGIPTKNTSKTVKQNKIKKSGR